MEIALHLGVPLTDEDKLVQCLMRNRALLASQRIAVPGVSTYRSQLRALCHDMRDQPTDSHTQEILLDGLLDKDDVTRVVFSMPEFLAVPRWIIAQERFYPDAGERIAQLRHLFPEATLSLYLAIRNPASYLPALAADDRAGGVASALKGVDPASLRWSEMLARIVTECPDIPVTVWSDEDTPLLWPEVLQVVSGCAPESELEGWFAWYWDLMSPTAHEAMRRYFKANPVTNPRHRRRILKAMLEKFARPEALEAEIALEGWDADYTEILSEIYEQDLDLIATLPGVTLLEP